MKKTTKLLLVLAAVVAMTIGAVSTVMAADDVLIATWGGNEKDGYTATDTNGKAIRTGWAKDPASGLWYYFANSKMTTSRFITTGTETYYVNANGQMHTGWMEFNSKQKVSFNGAEYDNVKSAFNAKVGSGEVFKKDTDYATVWFYFDSTGVMAKNEWEQVTDINGNAIWYYFDGPYCLMNEKAFVVKYDEGKSITDSKKYATYGFDASGAMLADWVCYEVENDDAKDPTNVDTPYEDPGKAATTNEYWAYYGTDGKLHTKNGWLKVGGDWFFMQYDSKVGVPACITNTYLKIRSGENELAFYFDKGGYMYAGTQYIYTAKKDGEFIPVKWADANYTLTADKNISVPKNTTIVLTFDTDGTLIKGIKDNNYYEDGTGNKYSVKTDVVTDGAIAVGTEIIKNKTNGVKWSESFLYVSDDCKTINYFVDGEKVKLTVIPFGDKALAFDKDGKLVATKPEYVKKDGKVTGINNKGVVIDGVEYFMTDEVLDGTTIKFSATKEDIIAAANNK